MANFTTEAAVRLKLQVNDTVWVLSALVTSSIGDAHEAILRRLDPSVDTESPEDELILGETLLAGAYLLYSLASKDAVEQKQVTVGGQRVETGKRFDALESVAKLTETQAWDTLAPYLAAQPETALAGVTDSVPVLGEEDES